MATDSRRLDWRDGALVGLAGLLVLLIADALVQDARTPRGDDQIYELMANDPFETHSFPFAYRFLVPTIVHVCRSATSSRSACSPGCPRPPAARSPTS